MHRAAGKLIALTIAAVCVLAVPASATAAIATPTPLSPIGWSLTDTPGFVATNNDLGTVFLEFELCPATFSSLPTNISWQGATCPVGFEAATSMPVAPGANGLFLADGPPLMLVTTTDYTWHVRASDGVSPSSWSPPVSGAFQVDSIPPPRPTMPMTVERSGSQLRFSWTSSPDAESGPAGDQFEASPDGTFDLSTNVSCTVTGSTAYCAGLPAGSPLHVRVRALDNANNVSPWSYGFDTTLRPYLLTNTPTSVFTFQTGVDAALPVVAGPSNASLSGIASPGQEEFPLIPGQVITNPSTMTMTNTPQNHGWVIDDLAGRFADAGSIDLNLHLKANATTTAGPARIRCAAWVVENAGGVMSNPQPLQTGPVAPFPDDNLFATLGLSDHTLRCTFPMPMPPIIDAPARSIYVEVWVVTQAGAGGGVTLWTGDDPASNIGAPWPSDPLPTPAVMAPAPGAVVNASDPSVVTTLQVQYPTGVPLPGSVEFELSDSTATGGPDGSFTTMLDLGMSGQVSPGMTGTIPVQIHNVPPGTLLHWHARARDMHGHAGPWSGIRDIQADNRPATPGDFGSPTVVSTGNNTLSADAFVDPDVGSGDGHATSHWQIRTDTGSYRAPIVDVVSAASTSFVVPSNVMAQDGKTFHWRVAYQDAFGLRSVYSAESTFVVNTVAPPGPALVTDGPQGGGDIAWTNTDAQLAAAWTDPSPPTDLQLYHYCFTTGTDCGAGVVADGDVPAGTLTVSHTSITPLPTSPGPDFYKACVSSVDIVGNASPPTCSTGQSVDLTAPVGVVDTIVEGSNPEYQFVDVTTQTIYYNPNFNGAFQVPVVTGDAESGIARVTFPSLGTGWSPSVQVDDTSPPFSNTYTWTVGAAPAGTQTVTVFNNAGGIAASDFTVVDDSTPPGPVSISYLNGYQTTATVNLTLSSADVGSGVALQTVERESATLLGDTCAFAGTWTFVANPAGTAYTDTGVNNGSCYRYRIIVTDNVGNTTTVTGTDVVKIDSLVSAPLNVYDGLAGDPLPAWSGDASTIDANWDSAVDPESGLSTYEFCVTITGSCPDVTSWLQPATPTDTFVSHSPLSLSEGVVYHVCVRAQTFNTDIATWPERCSSGQRVDVTPSTVAPVYDGLSGADIDWSADASRIQAHWDPFVDGTSGSGIQRYQYCIANTNPGLSGPCPGTWTNATPLLATTLDIPFSKSAGVTYFVCIRADDVVGNTSAERCQSDGQAVDTAPPVAPTVVDQPDVWQASTTTYAGGWSGASDARSGLDHYEYCVSTSSSCSSGIIQGWTTRSIGATTQQVGLANLNLVSGTTYHLCVRTFDAVSNMTLQCSNGVTVDATGPTVSITPVGTGSTVTGIVNLAGGVADAGAGAAAVHVTYSGAGGSGTLCDAAMLDVAGQTWSCPGWSTYLLPNGLYTVTATARDVLGNASSASTDIQLGNQPSTPGQIAIDGSTSAGATPRLPLRWLASIDGDGTPAKAYHVYLRSAGTTEWTNSWWVDGDPEFDASGQLVQRLTITSNIVPGGSYDVVVSSVDGNGGFSPSMMAQQLHVAPAPASIRLYQRSADWHRRLVCGAADTACRYDAGATVYLVAVARPFVLSAGGRMAYTLDQQGAGGFETVRTATVTIEDGGFTGAALQNLASGVYRVTVSLETSSMPQLTPASSSDFFTVG